MKSYFLIVISILVIPATLLSPCHGQKLDIEAKTSSYGGINSGGDTLDNIAVIWIQTPDSQFIKTLMVWSETGFDFMLSNWRLLSGIGDTGYYDGVTSATRDDHSVKLEASWDCKDTNGNQVPAGTYEYWVEMNEHDYWWGQIDPNEVYPGKVTKGTIDIDFQNEKNDTGLAIANIFDIFVKFAPTGIITDIPNKDPEALSFLYNPLTRHLEINLGAFSSQAGKILIYNLNGTLVNTIQFNRNTGSIVWDGKNNAGKTLPSGVYLFDVRANETRIKPSAHSITLYK